VLLLAAGVAAGQSGSPAGITQRTIGELETRNTDGAIVRYTLSPADHVVGGDQLVYTVEIRNTTNRSVGQVVAISPIPGRMSYVAGSAAGPGCEIDFSVDGGTSFGKPEDLVIALPAGKARPAAAADYTHIRWRLKFPLSASAIAYARFRALLK
jgi:uncharacterized repeat protein (TIGR01451 family)